MVKSSVSFISEGADLSLFKSHDAKEKLRFTKSIFFSVIIFFNSDFNFLIPQFPTISPIANIVKLNKLLPITLPKDALKLLSLTKLTDDVSSGKDVATPKNIAPPTVVPRPSCEFSLSVTWVKLILNITNKTDHNINLIIICFTVKSSVSSSSLFSLELSFNFKIFITYKINIAIDA